MAQAMEWSLAIPNTSPFLPLNSPMTNSCETVSGSFSAGRSTGASTGNALRLPRTMQRVDYTPHVHQPVWAGRPHYDLTILFLAFVTDPDGDRFARLQILDEPAEVVGARVVLQLAQGLRLDLADPFAGHLEDSACL